MSSAAEALAPTPAVPALDLFSLKGQNALITGGSRGEYEADNPHQTHH
jgi:hypothetical protein